MGRTRVISGNIEPPALRIVSRMKDRRSVRYWTKSLTVGHFFSTRVCSDTIIPFVAICSEQGFIFLSFISTIAIETKKIVSHDGMQYSAKITETIQSDLG